MDSCPGFGPVYTWNSAENTTQPLPSRTQLQVSFQGHLSLLMVKLGRGPVLDLTCTFPGWGSHYRQWVELILSIFLEGDVVAVTGELWAPAPAPDCPLFALTEQQVGQAAMHSHGF